VTAYLIRRVAQALVVVFGVTLLIFVLEQLVPGGEARAALGQKANAVTIARFNHQNGLDLPLWQQYWNYVRDLVLHFNLGYSYKSNQTVQALIEEKLPKTLFLVGLSTALSALIAIPLGVLQVVRRNTPIDYAVTS
jgi:peptide/nickel transport system permease protein